MREGSVRYSAAVALELCEQIASGQTIRGIIARPDMPCWKTIQQWLLRHSDFAEKYRTAQALKADWEFDGLAELEDRLMEPRKIDGIDTPRWIDPQAMRVAIDSKKWRLAKMKPSSYGDHRHQQVTVSVGNSFARLLQSLDDRPMLDVTPRRDGND